MTDEKVDTILSDNTDACIFLPGGVLTIAASFDVEDLAKEWVKYLQVAKPEWSETTVLLTNRKEGNQKNEAT